MNIEVKKLLQQKPRDLRGFLLTYRFSRKNYRENFDVRCEMALSAIFLFHVAFFAEDRLFIPWLKWELGNFCSAFCAFPIALKRSSLAASASASVLISFLLMTLSAEDRSVSVWLKWELGNFRSAFRTSPISFVHCSVSRILIIHFLRLLFCQT